MIYYLMKRCWSRLFNSSNKLYISCFAYFYQKLEAVKVASALSNNVKEAKAVGNGVKEDKELLMLQANLVFPL